MSSELELLELRKNVLVARASLQRLKIGVELQVLREDLRWPRAVSAIAKSRPVRTALFGGLLVLVGRGRLARFVAAAAAALALAKVAAAFTHRTPAADASEPAPGD
jgi:hypothetical protein